MCRTLAFRLRQCKNRPSRLASDHGKDAGGGIVALPLVSRTLHSRVECQPFWHAQVNRTLHLLLESHQLRRSLLDEFGVATVFHPYTGFEVVGSRRVDQVTIGERGDRRVEWLQRSCPLWYGEDATDTDDDVVVDEAVAWCCKVLVDVSEVVSAMRRRASGRGVARTCTIRFPAEISPAVPLPRRSQWSPARRSSACQVMVHPQHGTSTALSRPPCPSDPAPACGS